MNGRYCNKDELWVCPICGKHVEHDRFAFDDESCMLNARVFDKDKLVYKDDNQNMRVIAVKPDDEDEAVDKVRHM